MGRNPGELTTTVEEERLLIEKNADHGFAALVGGQIVGQASAYRVRPRQRFCHRAALALLVDASRWGIGIGGKLMQACIDWCYPHPVEQLEVVDGNQRAIAMHKCFGFVSVGRMPKALKYLDGTDADEIVLVKEW